MIHAESVSQLARVLGRVPAEMATELQPALREAGEAVMHASQANASWSSRIPAAHYLETSVSQTGGVAVRVDQTLAPHARPYEGISAGADSRGFFRHPVYGNDWWVSEGTRPFLRPAVESEGDHAKELIAAAIRKATSL
jgi:hypothetical protein